MKYTNFKTKVLFLSVAPMLVISVLLTLLSSYYAKALWSTNTNAYVENFQQFSRNQLKQYTQLALTSIDHLYNNPNLEPEYAKAEALKILSNLRYGKDGYFFVTQLDGHHVMHPIMTHLNNRNLWDLQDPDGVYLIRLLVEAAKKEGGGFSEYKWHNPSLGRVDNKLTYSVAIDKWNWLIGTGAYRYDLEQTMGRVDRSIKANTQEVLMTTIGLSLVLTLIVAVIAIRCTMSQRGLASQKLQHLSRLCIEDREHECSKVAAALNDSIAKGIYASIEKIKVLLTAYPYKEDNVKSQCLEIGRMLKTVWDSTKQLSNDILPEILVEKGMCFAVEDLAERLSEEHDIRIKVTALDQYERVTSSIEMACYYIVREALDNVVEHSQAKEVNIRLRRTNSMMKITIQDDGIGFEPREKMESLNESGIGLTGMQLRTELLNGLFTVFSSKGTGTIIKISIPLV